MIESPLLSNNNLKKIVLDNISLIDLNFSALGNDMIHTLLNIKDAYNARRLVTINMAFANQYGLIFNAETCHTLRNGGCYGSRFKKIFDIDFRSCSHHSDIILLTSSATGTWHFPMEVLVALADLPEEFIKNTFIYISGDISYVLSWLRAIGLPNLNLITDKCIYADRLHIPEQGRCGEPYISQIKWLSKKIHQQIMFLNITSDKLQNTVIVPANSNVTMFKSSASPIHVLIIKRNPPRAICDIFSIKQTIISLFQKSPVLRNFDLILTISDASDLPTIPEQVLAFQLADVIIAPHGAGTLFIAFATPSSCLIEFMPIDGGPLMYARLAYLRSMDYFMISMDSQPRKVRTKVIKNISYTKKFGIPCYTVNKTKFVYAFEMCSRIRRLSSD